MKESIPTTQKGIKVSKEGCVLTDIPVPTPRDDEVLIKNEVVASNPKDWKHAEIFDAVIVQGNDTVGTVVNVGKDVTGFKVGDYVAGKTPQSGPLGEGDRFGCYAQYTVAPSIHVFHMPGNKEPEEVATMPLAILTTVVALFAKDTHGLGLPSPLDTTTRVTGTLVINGASSSIGSFAVQLAKLVGWRVIGIAGAGGDYVRNLGADVIIDYRSKSKDELAKELQSHGPFSQIYDCVSDLDSVEFLSKALQPNGGELATVMPLANDKVQQLLLGNVIHKKTSVSKIYTSHVELGRDFCAWFPKALAENKLQGNKYRVIPNGLEGVAEGLALLKSGKISAEKLVYRIKETPGLN